MQFQAAILCVLAVATFAGCRLKEAGGANLLVNQSRDGGAAGETETFWRGLLAAPGSDARRQAGLLLERRLAAIYATLPATQDERKTESRRMMQKILGLTVDYLKLSAAALERGHPCRAEQKIRVYRGIGRQPILRDQAAPDKRLALMNGWQSALVSAFLQLRQQGELQWRDPKPTVTSDASGRPVVHLNGDDLGLVILRHAALLDAPDAVALPSLTRLDWQTAFQGFDWDSLSYEHSSDGSFSAQSGLMSTSLHPTVADTYGPANIVADVCPERAFWVTTAEYISEQEVLVPLFLLPEEIVRVEGLECGIAIKASNESITRATCYPEPLAFETEVSATTAAVRRCYAGFYGPASEILIKDNEFRFAEAYEPKMAAFYEGLRNANGLYEFRNRVTQLTSRLCSDICGEAGAMRTAIGTLERRLSEIADRSPLLVQRLANLRAHLAMVNAQCPQSYHR